MKDEIVTLSEYTSETHPDLIFTEGDHNLLSGINHSIDNLNTKLVKIFEGGRIEVTSCVGIIKFENFQLNITPKISNSYLHIIEMFEYINNLNLMKKIDSDLRASISDIDFFEFISMIFLNECQRIFKEGFRSDYLIRQEVLTQVRGKIQVKQQLMLKFGRVDKLHCEFDDIDSNILDNQLILFGLDIFSYLVKNPKLLVEINKNKAILRSICDLDDFLMGDIVVSYNRLNEYYRGAHEIVKLLIRHKGIKNIYDPKFKTCFSFIINTNVMFEQFMGQILSNICMKINLQVLYQHEDNDAITSNENKQYKIIPDYIVLNPINKRQIVIDIKYKSYKDGKVDNSDIYQIFFYSNIFNKSEKIKKGILIHVTEGEFNIETLSIQSSMVLATLKIVSIPIDKIMIEIKQDQYGVIFNSLRDLIVEEMGFSQST